MKSSRFFAKLFSVLCLAMLMLGVVSCSPSPQPQQSETYDLILFSGQSNMVGREPERYACDIPENMAYEYKAQTNKLYTVKNPSGENYKGLEASTGSSIVPRFCKDYIEATGHKVIVLHAACGGSSITRFRQGSGDLYKAITSKYQACLDFMEENNYIVGKAFYLFFQGSTDIGMEREMYKKYALSFHTGLKQSFSIDFGAWLYTGEDKDNLSAEQIANINTINGVKKEMAEQNDDIIICNKEAASYYATRPDFMLEDNLHYNAAGLEKIAEDSCAAILSYLGYGANAQKGVDPDTYLPEPDFSSVELPTA